MNTHSSKNKKTSQNASSNSSIWLLFIVACGCMFVIGVLVGRNTMPVRFDMEDLNKKLARLQKSVLVEDAVNAEKPFDQVPFEFYEELKNDRDLVFSDDDDMPLRRIKPRFQKEIPPSATIARADPETQRRQSPETIEPKADDNTRLPTQQAAPDRAYETSDTTQRDRSRGEFVIQVASLRDMQSAQAVSDKFRARGYPAYTQLSIVEGRGTWSRVRIGPYADMAQARKDFERLQQAGVDAILISPGNLD